jgi:predicted alpha-1,6-mannanase (GH76 family)
VNAPFVSGTPSTVDDVEESVDARLAADRDRLAMAKLLTFFRPRTGRWSTPTGEAWQPALAVETVVNSYERTRDPSLLDVIEKSFGRYRGRRSHFYDDDGWYLNAWLRAYDVTGDRGYLDEAEALFTEMATGWDGVCGGGLWWNKDRDYKNAITNELFVLAAAGLHRRAPDGAGKGSYHHWALRAWDWFDASGMINDAGEVNDGLNASCANNGDTAWTYNQGVILSGLVELWRVTGERRYLARARQIADATVNSFRNRGGILKEPCEPRTCNGDAQIFKGVFAQGLARLYRADPDNTAYLDFLHRNADSVWRTSRDRSGGLGLSWDGPPGPVTAATHVSALLLLGSVALLHASGETNAVPPTGGG